MNKPRSKDGHAGAKWYFGELGFAVIVATAILIFVWANDPGRLEAAAHHGQQFIDRARICFGTLTRNASFARMLYPALAMLLFAGTVRLLFQRPPDWMRLPVGFVFLALQIVYLTFRVLTTLCLDTWPDAMASIL